MEEITFTFDGLLESRKRIMGYRDNYPTAVINVLIREDKHNDLLRTGILGNMSLDDALGCNLKVI
jgi:hypothetical protein